MRHMVWYRGSAEERANREACIRNTIDQNPHNRDLSSREVDRAVERGMAISDGAPNQTFGNIASSAVATVRQDRGK